MGPIQMNPETMLLIGALLFSITVGYACWVKIRVIRLTEDLFAIRDGLFDKICDLAAFDDPAYRATREHLNVLIRLVPTLSVPVIVHWGSIAGSESSKESFPASDHKDVQEAIAAAFLKAGERVLRYLRNETLGGIALLLLSFCIRTVKQVSPESLARSFASDTPKEFEAACCS